SDATPPAEARAPRVLAPSPRQPARLHLPRPRPAGAPPPTLLLLASCRHYRRLSKPLDASHRQVLEQQQALLEANQQLERISMTDGLTGLANRRRFDERVALELPCTGVPGGR